jgi:hypothetical protein
MTFLFVTIKVHAICSMMEHVIQGNLNPCSWAIIIHIWLRINYFLTFFKIESFYVNTI